MKMKIISIGPLAVLSTLLIATGLSTGCGTIITLTNMDEEGTAYGYVYSGVRFDERGAFDDDYMQHIPFGKPLCVVDMPLSLVMDTIVIPATLTTECCRWFRSDERLLGKWKSDEDLTVSQYTWYRDKRWVDNRSVKPKTKPTITFAKRLMSVEVDGIEKEYSYRVVSKTTNSVEIVGPPSPIRNIGFTTIRFDRTGLWYLGGWSGKEMHYRKQ
jgi:uncharacterized protein YceK